MINGKYIIGAGLIIVLIGTIIYFFGDKLSWIGRLPGDISIEKENFKLYFPITTLLIISILLNVIIWLIKKFSN
jgi:NADH:ubiquinone oxidoreductase subunit 6 (subunit J)